MAQIIGCALPAIMMACLSICVSTAGACISSSKPRDLNCNCQPSAGNEAPVQVICSIRGTLDTIPDMKDEGLTGSYIMTISGGGTIRTVQENAFGSLKIVALYMDNIAIGNIEQAAFSSLGNFLQHLQLTGTRLSRLAAGTMEGLTSLLQLDISHNELSQLPDGLLEDVPQLELLNLAFNKFSSMSNNTFTRPEMQLQSLHLNDNQLVQITQGMFNLKELETLDLARNLISYIEDHSFSQVPKLSTLSLMGNLLTEINNTTLAGNQSLRYLQLQDNQIEKIHAEALNLVALQTIHLQNNSLVSLSPQWFSGKDQLQTVMLQNNLLSSVPKDTFRGCTALKSLNLSHNNIQLLPGSLLQGLVSLAEFDVEHNDISLENINSHFFAETARDTYLRLDNNRITTIPNETFYGIESCAELSLSYNLISEIHREVFGESVGIIASLYLDHNNLTVIHESVFSSLQAQSIHLGDNLIHDIADGAFSSPFLLTLSLKNNKLASVKRNTFDGTSALKRLDLSNNVIDSVESGSFSDPDFLEYLDLTNNRLEKISPGIFVGRIKYIMLSRNLIRHIEPYSFRQLTHTPVKVDLTHNLLTHVNAGQFSSTLDSVDLRWNSIQCISSDLLETLDQCSVSLCLEHNPFICNCNLVWLRQVEDRYSCWGCRILDIIRTPGCSDDLQYNILNFPYEDCTGGPTYCTEDTTRQPETTLPTKSAGLTMSSTKVSSSEVSSIKATPSITAFNTRSVTPDTSGLVTAASENRDSSTSTSRHSTQNTVHSDAVSTIGAVVTQKDDSTTKRSGCCCSIPARALLVTGIFTSMIVISFL